MEIKTNQNNPDFEDIRHYYDHEVNDALKKISKDPLFDILLKFVGLHYSDSDLKEKINRIQSSYDFQKEFMHHGIRAILKNSFSELSYSGFERLQNRVPALFIANHRDILLDSAILQVLLVEHKLNTSEITFGENLMTPGFITDFGRLNRMFRVKREGNSRELYDIAYKLSSYIRHTLFEKQVSVWIAQGNGRTKDGNDMTQTGLLKMLNLDCDKNQYSMPDYFRRLNIVPLSISYEYEPCDSFKTQELYLSSLNSKYVKAAGEDLNSIIQGVCQEKGRIHLAVCDPIANEIEKLETIKGDNNQLRYLKNKIDERILSEYKLWPVNYVAADLLSNRGAYIEHYSSSDKNKFVEYMQSKVTTLDGEKDVLTTIFLGIYANPVFNKEKNINNFTSL